MYAALTADADSTTTTEIDLPTAEQRLNTVRNQITHLRNQNRGALFRCAAQLVNPYELLSRESRVPVISRAYFKLWELLHHFGCLDGLGSGGCSVHLCEAPGAFVQATRDYWCRRLGRSSTQWSTVSVTLPGDLAWKSEEAVVYADILAQDRGWLQQLPLADLVTGDGGFEITASDKNDQELLNHPLLTAQLELGIQLLRPGGCLIVKLFDMFLPETRQLLQRVSQHFEEMHLVKPLGSRVCNSERYVVCLRKRADLGGAVSDNQLQRVAVTLAARQTLALQQALKVVQSSWQVKPWTLLKTQQASAQCRAAAQQALHDMECE
jgi:23S rRNA U2552 (ribose-2'-O)-methylase RlmE/FtsJ